LGEPAHKAGKLRLRAGAGVAGKQKLSGAGMRYCLRVRFPVPGCGVFFQSKASHRTNLSQWWPYRRF